MSNMMQRIRNRLPKLFRKNEKDKSPKHYDFDLANTLILQLSQKMQQLALSKKFIEQQRHAYYFKNSRRNQATTGKHNHFFQQRVGDRQLTGGHQLEKGLSQRASRTSLPPIPQTVNYSWLFDTEQNYKLNCFERAKIRDQCRQLTLDQSVLAYEIFLKRSEKVTEPTELPKILDEILSVLLSRKPVRKNCIEVFKKRMESIPHQPVEDKQTTLPSGERSTKSFRIKDAPKFKAMRSVSMPLCRDNSKINQKDTAQDQGEHSSRSVSSQILTALDKIRVVYVQSKEEGLNTENKSTTPKKIRFEKKTFRMSDGDVRNTPVASAVKESNENFTLKDRQRKVDKSKKRSNLSSSPVNEYPSSTII